MNIVPIRQNINPEPQKLIEH